MKIFDSLILINRDLLSEIEKSKELLTQKDVPREMEMIKRWIFEELFRLEDLAKRYIIQSSYKQENTESPLYKNTNKAVAEFRKINRLWISALLRYHKNDKFIIKVIQWLHQEHIAMKDVPFALNNSGFSILPGSEEPLLYFLPSSSQKNLLHLPLLVHEKGHAIYRHLKFHDELLELVKEYQEDLTVLLFPAFQNNSMRSQTEKTELERIINIWYYWIEELFCDMIGLYMAGEAYLYSLSHYLRIGKGESAFHIPEDKLRNSKHPVSWIRIKVLTHEARKLGLVDTANTIEKEWERYAHTLGIEEEFYGYYNAGYLPFLSEKLSDMMIEAGSKQFTDFEVGISEYDPGEHNFIQLMNLAWQKFHEDSEKYEQWEKQIIDLILSHDENQNFNQLSVIV